MSRRNSDPKGYIRESEDDPTAAKLGIGPKIVQPKESGEIIEIKPGDEYDPQREQRHDFEAAQPSNNVVVHPAKLAAWGIAAATGRFQYA